MITKKFILTITFGSFLLAWGCTGNSAPTAEQQEMYENFVNPPNRNRPQPFWHINGELTTKGIYEQITDAYQKDGFGGVAVLPLTPAQMWNGKEICPGTTPEYLSNEYFERYQDILTCSKDLGTEVILYDDVYFPSGVMGGRFQKEYPQYTQKCLSKQERDIVGPMQIKNRIRKKRFFVKKNNALLES